MLTHRRSASVQLGLLLFLLLSTPAALAQTADRHERLVLARMAAVRRADPDLADGFDADSGLWTTAAEAGGVQTVDGALRLALAAGQAGIAAAADIALADFLADLSVVIPSANESAPVAFFFRVVSQDTFYAFVVSGEGRVGLLRSLDGDAVWLVAPRHSPAVQTGAGAANQLTVWARGSEFALVVNDSLVAEVEDAAIASGTIGVGVARAESGVTSALFEEVTVWRMGAPALPALGNDVLVAQPTAAPPTQAAATTTPGAPAAPTAAPTPTPTHTPEPPVSLDALPIDWSGLDRYYLISDPRLTDAVEGERVVGQAVAFRVEAFTDVGVALFSAEFLDAEGNLVGSSLVDITIAPEATSFLDAIGGWQQGAWGEARFALLPRMAQVASIRFTRFL